MVSLKKLHVWICTPIQRLKCLAAIADTCQGLFRRTSTRNNNRLCISNLI